MKMSYLKATIILTALIGSQYYCFAETVQSPFEEKCVHNSYPPTGRPKIQKLVVDLDLDPLHRWDDLAKHKTLEIKNLLMKFKEFALGISNRTQFLINFMDTDLGRLTDSLPQPFQDEIRGLAKATNIPLGEIVMYNIFYEIFTVCTSIIAEDPSGKLYHARNLDFGLFLGWDADNHTWILTDALRPAIVHLEWMKGGKTLFRSINYAGYIGILTAVKKDIMTLTLNERFNIDGGYIGMLKWILGDRSATWMGFLTRRVLEEATSYKEARLMLANTPMLAPAYFILGGNKSGEACIITRSRDRAVDIWDIGSRNSSWYLLETNYDNWVQPFFLDDRRTPAHKCMKEMTRKKIGYAALFDVMSSKPVLNKLTTYTALMQVNSGHLEAFLQYCPDPCFPF